MVPVSDAVLCEVYPVKKMTARAQSLLYPDLVQEGKYVRRIRFWL